MSLNLRGVSFSNVLSENVLRRGVYELTVGLVIWPVNIVPEMTYYVSSGTLNPTHSLTMSPATLNRCSTSAEELSAALQCCLVQLLPSNVTII